MGSSEAATTKPLWQLGLDQLLESNGEGTHPYDRARVFAMARGMRMLGEEPNAREVIAYIRKLWEGWPHAGSMTREAWRSAYRSRTSTVRSKPWDSPLYGPDYLIEKHGVEPRTEERLLVVARTAIERLWEVANAEASTYLARRREVDAALKALEHLRFLRTGTTESLGYRDLNPRPPQRPQWS